MFVVLLLLHVVTLSILIYLTLKILTSIIDFFNNEK